MDKQERDALIEEYGAGYRKLKACLDSLPREMWQFKPASTEWSVHEIIVHLADSESNSALRARRLIVEPGQSVMAYDQDVWANGLNYHDQNWEDALETVRLVRKSTYELLKMQPDEVWTHAAVHPEFSDPYTFERWLKIYAAHIPGHIDQMRGNEKVWKEQRK
ncbi:MAG: DinB family protein [Chloroflexi bacterium]|nr:DinB family protein [Chloroflexota bacterium]